MAYYKKRAGAVSLRSAALPTLEKHQAKTRATIVQLEAQLVALRDRARAVPSLNSVKQRLESVELRLTDLHKVRRPKTGLIGSLFGLTEQPNEVRVQIDALNLECVHLRGALLEHASVERQIQSKIALRERANAWLSGIEEAIGVRRRKKESQTELRAAAAANSMATRKVGDTVKRELIRQPWCPYCGGSLGSDAHADHIYPVSKGGRSVPRNMVYVCASCNVMKSNLTLTGFIRKFGLNRSEIETRLEQLHKEF